ncbi:acyltransferase family protein [Muricoccus radiodurans]|uniref:acyltransferase family protein n=1 Tax=Muricoccus radiodurans TaxID=2231721 RepID=UPI003CFA34F5
MTEAADHHRHSSGLAALRGLAALVVVLCHCLTAVNVAPEHASALRVALAALNGSACVTLFFVLSGAVLAISFERDVRKNPRQIFGYWIRRGFRLYPLLWLAALMAAIFQLAIGAGQHLAFVSEWAHSQYQVAPDALPFEWAKNALAVTSSLNSPAWSIKVEIIGSLLFPLLFAISQHRKAAPVTVVALVIAMFSLSNPRLTAYMNVFTCSFLVGALITRWGGSFGTWFWTRSRPPRVLFTGLSVFVFLTGRTLLGDPSFVPPLAVLLEMTSAAFIVCIVLHGPPIRWFEWKSIRFLGEISYSVYLLHMIIIFVLLHTLGSTSLAPTHNWSVVEIGEFMFVVLLFTVPVAWITFLGVEQPMQLLGRWLDQRITGGIRGGTRPLSSGMRAAQPFRLP